MAELATTDRSIPMSKSPNLVVSALEPKPEPESEPDAHWLISANIERTKLVSWLTISCAPGASAERRSPALIELLPVVADAAPAFTTITS